MHSQKLPVLMIIGPTASGKSALALSIAAGVAVEIVSADSRQIYRFLDIGTAKPDVKARRRVPHHFVDERAPDATITAADFGVEAEIRISTILARLHRPVVVGGSTLYLQSLYSGLSAVPDIPAAVREELTAAYQADGLAPLVAELAEACPEEATRIDLKNPHRVIRALEVLRFTGKPLGYFHARKTEPAFKYQVLYVRPERAWLYARIEKRVDEMVQAGLFDEVRSVLDRGFSASLPALQTIGYTEVISALNGECSREEAIAAIKTNTKRYAKRQYTFFDKYFAGARLIDPAQTAPDDVASSQMIVP